MTAWSSACREATAKHKVVVVLVDPWTVRLQRYQRLMRALDEMAATTCVVIIPINETDGETAAQRANLEAVIEATFINRTAAPDPGRVRALDPHAGGVRVGASREANRREDAGAAKRRGRAKSHDRQADHVAAQHRRAAGGPMTAARKPGEVVTFYSYKGGTGRSMALANVAWILAANGKRVLVLDWDLEAPGLHRYFAPFLADHELATSDGIIDFLGKFADAVLTPARSDAEKQDDWYLAYADITSHATSLTYKFPDGGALDFIGAGRQGPAYAARVANFPWQTFYDRLGGGTLIDAARDVMKAEYDYILLDSRTGVSDAASICTMQLPDTLVVCFTLNNQSIAGAAGIARFVDQKAVGGRQMPVFPVPTRIENAETDKLEARRRYARSCFTLFPQGLDQAARDAYWGAMELRYVPYYAYEEVLAVFGDPPGREGSLLGCGREPHAAGSRAAPLRAVRMNPQERAIVLAPATRERRRRCQSPRTPPRSRVACTSAYRSRDARSDVSSLYNTLSASLGTKRVFMDVGTRPRESTSWKRSGATSKRPKSCSWL